MKLKQVLAVLGDQNGQVQTAGNLRIFVPAAFRDTVAAGEWVVVDNRSYDRSRLEGDPEGEFNGKGFEREEVVHAGSFKECAAIYKADAIADRAADGLVSGFVKSLQSELAPTGTPKEQVEM